MEDKTNFYILAIVAVVAIVGLIVMVAGNSGTKYTASTSDEAGQAVRSIQPDAVKLSNSPTSALSSVKITPLLDSTTGPLLKVSINGQTILPNQVTSINVSAGKDFNLYWHSFNATYCYAYGSWITTANLTRWPPIEIPLTGGVTLLAEHYYYGIFATPLQIFIGCSNENGVSEFRAEVNIINTYPTYFCNETDGGDKPYIPSGFYSSSTGIVKDFCFDGILTEFVCLTEYSSMQVKEYSCTYGCLTNSDGQGYCKSSSIIRTPANKALQ